VDIFKHTAKKNKKIKRADHILPEVYGTTLNSLSCSFTFIYFLSRGRGGRDRSVVGLSTTSAINAYHH